MGICIDISKQDTCQVEKMGCEGCNYFKKIDNIKDMKDEDYEILKEEK